MSSGSGATRSAAQLEADVDERLNPTLVAAYNDDPGLRLDARDLTRRSMPQLWRHRSSSAATSDVPNAAELLATAVRARRADDTVTYEACMLQLVSFFTDPITAAPARSPDEVRRAFSLAVDDAFIDETARERKRFAWLDGNATWQACYADVDTNHLDVFKDAEAAAEARVQQQECVGRGETK